MSDLLAWALEKWPFGVGIIIAVGFIYSGLIFGWGPDVVRPVSAQTVQQQITAAKSELLVTVSTVQSQLKVISDGQAALQKQQTTADRERIEQQLLWWRQQNCRSKGAARNYTWQKMGDLRDRYRELTSSEWAMPACSDIGE
jgi:hypothetical protein